jgi:GntR family transcriptional regulator
VAVTPNDPRPPYIQVADDLRAAIAAGRYSPGERLPSNRDLAQEYGVALMTMQRALGTLADEGHVALYKSRGTFVRSPDADQQPRPTLDGLAREIRELRETVHSLDDRLAELERGGSGA